MNRSFIKSTLLTITFLIIILLAACQPMAMKRESLEPDLIIQPADLHTALDMSLQLGDGRKVDFSPFGLGWEG